MVKMDNIITSFEVISISKFNKLLVMIAGNNKVLSKEKKSKLLNPKYLEINLILKSEYNVSPNKVIILKKDLSYLISKTVKDMDYSEHLNDLKLTFLNLRHIKNRSKNLFTIKMAKETLALMLLYLKNHNKHYDKLFDKLVKSSDKFIYLSFEQVSLLISYEYYFKEMPIFDIVNS